MCSDVLSMSFAGDRSGETDEDTVGHAIEQLWLDSL